MSRSSAPVLTSLLLLLLLPPLLLLDATISRPASRAPDIGCSLKSCAALDVAVLQEYVSSLNASATGFNETDADGSSEPVELLPFGALPSDWSRLLLLQNRQPEGTPLHENLLRLSRLMLVAYFDSEDRNEWEIQFSANDYGQNGSSVTIGNLIAVPYTEFDDQQANNVTLNSTAQKGSTWFNTSSNIASDAYNNEELLRGRNSTGNEGDSTTASDYDFSSLTIGTTNFNQNFSSSTADNETSGNKSNENFAATDNEEESFWATARTSGDSFASSNSQSNELEEDKNQSSAFIAIGVNFASPTSSDEENSENSSANEAIHVRSKEKFTVTHTRKKDDENESVEEDEGRSGSFIIFASDESIGNRRVKSSEDSAGNRNKSATKPSVSFSRDPEIQDSEELLIRSIEDLFSFEDEANRTGVSNFANSTDLVADEVDPGYFMNSENGNGQELLTKSIEDFFASEEESNGTALASEKIHSEGEENFHEAGNETDKFKKIPWNTSDAPEDFLKANGTDDEITSQVPSSSESNKLFQRALQKSNETFMTNWTKLELPAENLTSAELIANELFLSTNPSVSASTQSSEDFYKLESSESEAKAQKSDNLDFDKLISSVSVGELLLNAGSSGELNSTGEEKSDDNPTTLAQLISRSFPGAILAATAVYSNEITEKVDSTSSLPNGTEDRSAKYPNIPATISPSLLGNTTDQDKANEKAHIPASELDEGFQNRAIDLADDLFRKTTMKRRPEDDWSSTTAVVSSERASSDEETNESTDRLRNIFTIYRHNWSNDTQTATKLRKVEESSWREDENQDENEGDIDTWELKDRAFNLSATSSRNQRYKKSNGIVAEATMNKRKTRKRVGAELDVEKQYRTLPGRESRQTQFAKKK